MTNEKRIVDYREMKKMFDEQYKNTAELIRNGETHLDNLAEGFLEADRVISELPAVDAVEVVRCKDCKHYRYEQILDLHECEVFGGAYETVGYPTEPDDFCSYGERKTE